MLDKRVRIPMIAGIVVYGISIVLSILCALSTQKILPLFSTIEYEGMIFSPSILKSMVYIVLYIAFYFIMQTTNGSSNRVIGIILLVAYGVSGIVNFFWGFIDNIIAARKGVEYLAAASSMSTATSIVTLPFTLAASILIVVAIGRFGIIGDLKASEDNASQDDVGFGG